MKEESWMNDPEFENIDPQKLQKLLDLAGQAQKKDKKELLPFLMNAISQSGNGSLSFDSTETNAIIRALKVGRSPQEIQRIDRICTLMRKGNSRRK